MDMIKVIQLVIIVAEVLEGGGMADGPITFTKPWVGMSKLCFLFYLLCYALIPELLPIMLLKTCLLFRNYASVYHTNHVV